MTRKKIAAKKKPVSAQQEVMERVHINTDPMAREKECAGRIRQCLDVIVALMNEAQMLNLKVDFQITQDERGQYKHVMRVAKTIV